ncbi:CHAP domain-containing protein [Streptococcus sp. H31]|uniref:CHAP domain-containing protein n=1 Tax=Streptococcus huangxiaojuni TaxID=3237239 RepID=UPI0034A560B7
MLLVAGLIALIAAPAVIKAHTAKFTVHETNEYFTRLAAEGSGIDYDGAYGMQCVDVAYMWSGHFVDVSLLLHGNAIDLPASAQSLGYEIVPADKSPRVGDLFVKTEAGHDFGHTGYIWQVDPDGTIWTVEQNIGDYSNLYYGTPAQIVHRDLSDMVCYIRVAYQK